MLEFLTWNENLPYHLIFVLVLIYFLVFWVASIVYVWNDSRYYTSSKVVRFFYVFLTSLFGLLGIFLYLFFRESITDKSESECASCSGAEENGYQFCTECGKELFKVCNSCGERMFVSAAYCPRCGENQQKNYEKESTPVGGITSENKVSFFSRLPLKFLWKRKRRETEKSKLPDFKSVRIPKMEIPKIPRIIKLRKEASSEQGFSPTPSRKKSKKRKRNKNKKKK